MKNKKLVFDLDYTLYSPVLYPEENYVSNRSKFYVDLKSDIKLSQLLKKSENYIFTNANEEHMDVCLKKMRIKTMFKNTAFNDLYNGSYKPNKDVYELVIKKFKFKEDDTIYFFEDLKENLKTAKDFNWNTVYLDHNDTMKKKPKYIDYKFTNIYDAVEFIQKL